MLGLSSMRASRSKIGEFSGDSSVRGAQMRAFWPLTGVQAKGGHRPRELNRMGGGSRPGSGHLKSVE
jgi:hypothetical protein